MRFKKDKLFTLKKYNMEKEIKALGKYGTVKTCKMVSDNVATIVLTTGFKENANKTFSFIKDCMMLFPKHTVLETCITENDFAMVVLKTH